MKGESEAGRVLIIDDDEAMLRSLHRALASEGLGDALLCRDPREAPAFLDAHDIDVVLLDLVMPNIGGEELLSILLGKAPETPVIVVTATDHVETAVRCIKAGAFDYLVKPVEFSRLIADIARARQQRDLRLENRRLRDRLTESGPRHPEHFARITTCSPAMLAVFRYVEAIALSPDPVLIVGETGVGKELIAEALCAAGPRPGEMVGVNVAGIDEQAFADTLFGHVRGAFTGADREREGLIVKAGEGTLFLDEIGDLGLDLQTKLLRLVQEQEFFPLGADVCRPSRCRVVAATNRDLRQRMREGRFREDLYYRLHSHLVRVPPLCQRVGDIPLLVERFLGEAAQSLGKPVPAVPKELFTHLAAYDFPGNVRELRAMVRDAVARHERGTLSLAVFHEHMDRGSRGIGPDAPPAPQQGAGLQFGKDMPTLKQALRILVREALSRSDGNQAVAARVLGISRRTVNRYAAELARGVREPKA